MSKCSENIRTICGLAGVAAIIIACPARAADDTPFCLGIPYLDNNPVLAFGHVTSAANRIHFVKGAMAESPDCPSRAPACVRPDYLVPGDRVVIISDHRYDAFICVLYIDAKGGAGSSWLPADAVADDKAEPVALADWLGHWHYKNEGRWPRENDITVKAGNAGALRIEGVAKDLVDRETSATPTTIKSDVTPAGDRLKFSSSRCKVWMQRVGPWLIVKDGADVTVCAGRNGTTFSAVYRRQP
jgi:hypothetical protein